ncbi:MAG: 4'-phosphopantetheinyl transferase superfamily protein [Mesorhizobium sp.]|nr:MAG: 4'-phosphopantetheinyl transferase superfamily protein [Mesorhizobium sp.]
MTPDCYPELDFIEFSDAGGNDCHGVGAGWDSHAVSVRPEHRLIGVGQLLVEPAPPPPNVLGKIELRPETIMPVLENDGLEILAFMLDVEPNVVREMGVCLNEEERRRAEGLRLERDRRRFVATRGRLRQVLASKLGISPSEVELEYGHRGKPHLSHRMGARNLCFSVSRSGDVAVVALSTRQEVGVDIEAVRPVPEADEIAALCFSASEYGSYTALGPEDRLEGFLRRWTRLEAISKALGCGLGQPSSWDEGDWAVRRFVPKPGYIGTVVVRNW